MPDNHKRIEKVNDFGALSRITIEDYDPKVNESLKAKMDYFYSNYNMKVAYQKYMDFIQENEAFERLDNISKARNKIRILRNTKWNNIAKVVLTKDKRLLHKVLSEMNPEKFVPDAILEKPLSNKDSPRRAKIDKQQSILKEQKSKHVEKNELKNSINDLLKSWNANRTIGSILKSALVMKITK